MNARNALAACIIALAAAVACAESTVIATVPLKESPSGYAYDPVLRKVFVSNFADGTISIVDVDSGTITGSIAIPTKPKTLWVDAAAHRLYVLNANAAKSYTVIDTKANAVVRTVPYVDQPWAFVFDARRGELYVVSHSPNSLAIVGLKQGSVQATFAMDGLPYVPGVSSRFGKLYVPLYDKGTVAVFDLRTRKPLASIKAGQGPTSATVEDASGFVYITNYVDSTITVIDAATDTVKTTFFNVDTHGDGFFAVPSVAAVYKGVYIPDPNKARCTSRTPRPESRFPRSRLRSPILPSWTSMPTAARSTPSTARATPSTILDARLERVSATLERRHRAVLPDRREGSIAGVQRQRRSGGYADHCNAARHPEGHGDRDRVLSPWIRPLLSYRQRIRDASAARRRVRRRVGRDLPVLARVDDAGAPGAIRCAGSSARRSATRARTCIPLTSRSARRSSRARSGSTRRSATTLRSPTRTATCAPGKEELYRLYNGGQGGAPNHSMTPSRAVRDLLMTKAWVPEGTGPQAVYACTPPLRGWVTSAP